MDASGPGMFFRRYPALYAVSLIAAASAGVVFAGRAARSSGPKRFGWAALAAFQAVQVVGIIQARRGSHG
jgi:hypothetical protein